MAGEQFDKDFGYLMPFLNKIAAAGSSISDPAAREELARLIADEKSKWTRIRQLLSEAQSEAAKTPAPAETASQAINATHDGLTTREPFSLTVGSLRPRKS